MHEIYNQYFRMFGNKKDCEAMFSLRHNRISFKNFFKGLNSE